MAAVGVPEYAGRVVGMWRYPVKSMGGEALSVGSISRLTGITGDRRFAVGDTESGKIISAKTEPRLLWANARLRPDGGVMVYLPSGVAVRAGSCEANEAISDWLGRHVALWTPKPGESARFDYPVDAEGDARLGTKKMQPGWFFDGKSQLHLVTVEALEHCAGLVPDAQWASARFRPNLLIATGITGFREKHWVNATLKAGTVTMWVWRQASRCVMTYRAQPGISEDRRIFETLVRRLGNNLGVYANPLVDGEIACGDDLFDLGVTGPPPELGALAH